MPLPKIIQLLSEKFDADISAFYCGAQVAHFGTQFEG